MRIFLTFGVNEKNRKNHENRKNRENRDNRENPRFRRVPTLRDPKKPNVINVYKFSPFKHVFLTTQTNFL